MYPPWLTFRHWSGVTPYTSSYEFAGSCVFGKQLPGKLSLRPPALASEGQALSLTYGRFFAEFLEDISLVRLALLELTTCVGLRYGRTRSLMLEVFLETALYTLSPLERGNCLTTWGSALRIYLQHALIAITEIQFPAAYTAVRHSFAPIHGHGILTVCPSGAALAIPLGPTNPQLITIAEETLVFRRAGFSPALWLLVPAFSLLYAPPWVIP